MIKWIFKRFKSPSTSVFELDEPWDEGESIYEYIERHLDAQTGKFDNQAGRLPDEPEPDDSRLRWAPGALDGVMGHHSTGDAEIDSARLAKLILQVDRARDNEAFSRLYQALCSTSALQQVDAVLEQLVTAASEPPPHLRALAVRLATQAPEREAVKMGIALLGLVAETEDEPILMTLGSHDEFSLFAIVAVCNAVEESEQIIWQLAQRLDGWGRIHAVERLDGSADPAIRNWMLREGFRNSVMYEYLALTCAQTGDIAGALDAATVDQELLLGAAELLDTLTSGMGPAGDIDDYTDAARAIRSFLKHVRFAPPDLTLLSAVTSISSFLDNENDSWQFSADCGWSEDEVASLSEEVGSLLARDGWREAVEQGLRGGDSREYHLATQAAPHLGIDPWEHHFRRLEQGEDHWYSVMKTDDVARIDRVIALAETSFDLEVLASGPANALGLGPEWNEHMNLDFIVQELRRFPGRGWRLIETALQSPVIRSRNMALKALNQWDEAAWPDQANLALIRARNAEPNDDVRERIDQLLDTGTFREEETT